MNKTPKRSIGLFCPQDLSGNRIEPRLIPLGAAGLCISFLLLGVIPPNFTNVLVFIGLAGFAWHRFYP